MPDPVSVLHPLVDHHGSQFGVERRDEFDQAVCEAGVVLVPAGLHEAGIQLETLCGHVEHPVEPLLEDDVVDEVLRDEGLRIGQDRPTHDERGPRRNGLPPANDVGLEEAQVLPERRPFPGHAPAVQPVRLARPGEGTREVRQPALHRIALPRCVTALGCALFMPAPGRAGAESPAS